MGFGGGPMGPGMGPGMGGGAGVFGGRSEREGRRKLSDTVLLKRLVRYMRRYQHQLIIIIASVITSSLCNTMMPYLHSIAIDQIISPGNFSGFYWWVPVFLSIATLGFITMYLQQYLIAYVGENVISEVRRDMMKHLQVLSLRYFAEGETGRVMSRVTNDAEAVRVFFRMGITTVFMDIATITGALVLMTYLNPQLTLISVIMIPIILGFTFILGHFSRKAYRVTRMTISTVTSLSQEAISGMKVIQSFTREEGTMDTFNKAQDENVKSNLNAARISLSSMPVTSSMRILGTVLILWFATTLYQSGVLNVSTQLGILVAFLEYQMQLFMPLMTISQVYIQYQSAMSGLERMFDVLDTDVEVKELPQNEILELPPLEKEILFDHVTFGYDQKVPVIHDVSFNIPYNQKVAIVGPTGAGKSTLINLLCRFYDPLSGNISIDGHDLKAISLSSLRSKIGIVLQDSFLFNTTVRENIRYGRPLASDEEVINAAKAVGAHDFIMRLPDGYDMVISEGSSNISLGQRQLISFARALLVDPTILILDEATSSVDPYTELIIQNALQKLLENRTAIIIAHRLSTVRSANKIVVLNGGQIVEEGTHRQLLGKDGLYSLLYRSQLRDDIKV
ncbi:MAG: ATP-binding cassette, subfamily multidrug efflux pump [Thermoproteota archaeon]|nr:ATP-binding cassette, subfamily multidrug efflux pump [Thermoproteota archaeon]